MTQIKTPVEISICKTSSSSLDRDGKFHLTIKDENSRIAFFEIYIDPADFANLISGGTLSDVEATVHGMDKVGKKRFTESRSVISSIDTYDRKMQEQWIIDNCQEEGWTVSPYLGSQSSIVYVDGKTQLNYTVYKYVD